MFLVVALLLLFFVRFFFGVQLRLSGAGFGLDSQQSSLESGFEALKSVPAIRSSFFLLAVLFVLFDVELILLIPLIPYLVSFRVLTCFVVVLVLSFLVMTLLVEWWWYGLKWQC